MNHYEVLGVAPSASSGDVRKAYLDLARRHHPDRAVGAGSDATATTSGDDGDAGRMREINAAWTVLRDADRRYEYDQQLAYRDDVPGLGRDGSGRAADPGHQAPRRSRPENATTPGWQPLDDDDIDDAELLDDTPVEGTQLPRWLQVGPAFLLIGGIIGLIVGLIAKVPPLVALGLTSLVLSMLSFLAVPVYAIFNSRSHDPNP